MPSRSDPRPGRALTPETIRSCRDIWDAQVAQRAPMPAGLLTPFLERLEAAPDEWLHWRQEHGVSDSMTRTLWHGLMSRYSTRTEGLAVLTASWRRYASTVAATPLLAATALEILSRAIADLTIRDAHQTYLRTLRELIETAPSGAAPCYSTTQLMGFLSGTELRGRSGGGPTHDPVLADAFSTPIGRHLGLSAALMRTVWTDDLGGWSVDQEADRRARIAMLLDEAPMPCPAVGIVGRSTTDGDRWVATGWSFYRRHIAAFLRHALFAGYAEDAHLQWAWSHPDWRPALLLHGGSEVLERARFWDDPTHVAEALVAIVAMGPTLTMLPAGTPRFSFTHWLQRVARDAALGPWLRAALAIDAGRQDLRADIWRHVSRRVQEGAAGSTLTPEDWLPFLQSPDGQERAQAVLLAGAHHTPTEAQSPRVEGEGATARPRRDASPDR